MEEMLPLWLGLGGGFFFFGMFSGLGLMSYLRAKAIVKLHEAGYTVEGSTL